MNWEYFLGPKEQRFLSLLYLLEKHPCTLEVLGEYSNSSIKTVKRDLDELATAFGFYFTEGLRGLQITWENPVSYSHIKRYFLKKSESIQIIKAVLLNEQIQPPRYPVRNINRLIAPWGIKIIYRNLTMKGNPLVIRLLRKSLSAKMEADSITIWCEEWRYLLADNAPFFRFYQEGASFKKEACRFFEKQLEVAANPEADWGSLIESHVLEKVEETMLLIQRYFGRIPRFLYHEIASGLLLFYLEARLSLPLSFICFQMERRSLRACYAHADYRRIAEIVRTQRLVPSNKKIEFEIAKIFFYILEPLLSRVQNEPIRIGLAIEGSQTRVYDLQQFLQQLFQPILPVSIGIAKDTSDYDLIVTNHHRHPVDRPLLYFDQLSEKDIALVLYKRLVNQS